MSLWESGSLAMSFLACSTSFETFDTSLYIHTGLVCNARHTIHMPHTIHLIRLFTSIQVYRSCLQCATCFVTRQQRSSESVALEVWLLWQEVHVLWHVIPLFDMWYLSFDRGNIHFDNGNVSFDMRYVSFDLVSESGSSHGNAQKNGKNQDQKIMCRIYTYLDI